MDPVERPRNWSRFASPASVGRLFAAVVLLRTLPVWADERPPVKAHLDLVATDARGRPVTDLRPDDLRLLLDGVPQTVDSVRLISADGRTAPADAGARDTASSSLESASVPSPGARIFGLFLDDFQVGANEADAIRGTLRTFIQRDLGPRDQLLVVRPFDSLLTLKLSDRETALSAIAGFAGRRDDLSPRSTLERDIMGGSPERIGALRTQVARSAINALALHLGSAAPGRKSLIAVGRGWAGGGVRARGEAVLPALDTIVRSANRSGVAVYPVSPAAFGAAVDPGDVDGLNRLAAQTGGHAIVEAAALESGLKQVVGEASAYYLVTFGPGPRTLGSGGSDVRPLEVVTTRKAVHLDVRRSLGWGSLERSAVRLAAAVDAPPRPPEPARHRSPLVRPWFGFARGTIGSTRVHFVWEPVAPVPGDRTRGARPDRLTLRAFSADGVPLFESVVAAGGVSRQITATGSASPGGPGGADADAIFEVPPGRVRIEMTLQDASARVVDTDVRDVLVQPLASSVAIGSPEVFRASTALEYRALVDARNAVPVSSREFSRFERLVLRVPVYGTSGPPVMTLLGRTGSVMRTLPVAPFGGVVPDASTMWYQLELPLATLAPGEYSIAMDTANGEVHARETLTFRVTS